MFQYCVDVLRLSEAEAYLRIKAARASRRFPVLLTLLADGRLHLSAIETLAPHLTDDNCDELLTRATHQSKETIKVILAEMKPKPDVQPRIRKRPAPKAVPAPPKRELRLDAVASAPPQPAPRPVVEPLPPARYKVEFTASEELRDKLKRLEALMPGCDLTAVIDAAVSEKLERVESKRYGKANKPRKAVDDVETSADSRYIPAPIKRAVCARDRDQCTHVSPNGMRCPERERLEFHHELAYALGGEPRVDNIRLLCREHNFLQAELDFGKAHMNQFRRPV